MKNTGKEIAYPLTWPQGRPRHSGARKRGPFRLTLSASLDDLFDELRLMGARYIVVSSNVPGYVRNGIWRPKKTGRKSDDPGVATYFDLDGESMCMVCDRWQLVSDNVRGVGKSVEAIRGLARWGCPDMMRRAFSGFRMSLPAAGIDWRGVLDMSSDATIDAVRRRHRELAIDAHPDRGGNLHEMVRLNQALEAAKQELS